MAWDSNGFNNALATKYSILGQNADANLIAARGQANLANANAGQVAANAASHRAVEGALTFKTGEEGKQVAPLAQSHIGLESAQGNYYNAQAGLAGHEGDYYDALGNRTNIEGQGLQSDLAPAFHAGTSDVSQPLSDQELHAIHRHLCMGGTIHAMSGLMQVPGKPTPAAQVGTQASDQVPAMLAPDEAVLNKHGADIIGRDKIAAANAIGNHMAKQDRQSAAPAAAGPQGKAPAAKSMPGKGMTPPKSKAAPKAAHGAPMKHQTFSAGTHQVMHGKSAKTPTKIDPAAAMALLQMAQGGAGGMPQPQPQSTPAPVGNLG